jgi:predicted PhzF superfamily epimerase YddE/YHI9
MGRLYEAGRGAARPLDTRRVAVDKGGMKLPLYQVDAFATRLFSGNPAAICPLPRWLPDAMLQAISAENNLSETAFIVGGGGCYEIRWMTPVQEVDLCGHATLGAAWVVLVVLEPGRDDVEFSSRGGPLRVRRDGERLVLDFPSRPAEPCREPPPDLVEGLGRPPREVWRSRDFMAVYEAEDDVRALAPDMARLARLDALGVIATAPGRTSDFVSRFFAPGAGIPEDPVTGSAHCTLVPYWARRLGRARLRALQVSPRGGELHCEDRGERVAIAGSVVRYLEGTIEVT